jgi:hypothetical protein
MGEGSTSASGQSVGGVAVKRMPRAVVAAGSTRVGVAGRILDIAQRDPSIQRQGHHRMPQAVRSDALGEPGPPCEPGHNPGGVVAVQPAEPVGHQQRALGAATKRRIECADGPRGQRHQHALAALAHHREYPVGPLDTKVDDIGRACLGYSQPVQGEQAGEGVIAGRGGLSRGQEPDRLLAVEAKRLRITRHRGATNVGGGGVGEWGSAPSWTA